MEVSFRAPMHRWEGESAWHYLALPEDAADEIEDSPAERRGFGSIRVLVRVGGSEWSTSLFPDKSRGTFLLFIKKEIRTREGIDVGDMVDVTLETID